MTLNPRGELIFRLLPGAMLKSEGELLAELFASTGEDFAVPQDPVSGGRRTFFAYAETLRLRICRSEARLQLKADFEKSGPLLVAMMAMDEYLASHSPEVQVTVAALIFKLGIDRVCAELDAPSAG